MAVLSPVAPIAPSAPVAGLYVQVASLVSQAQAAKAGLELVERLSSMERPRFIRGVLVNVHGRRRIRLFAGPFAGRGAAAAFCELANPRTPCLTHDFPALDPIH